MQNNALLFLWLGLFIAFIAIEALTVQLTTIWFALGALVSLLLVAFGVGNLAVQAVVFAAVSVLALIFTRPLVKKFITRKIQPTNADMCIGSTAKVTEDIDNSQSKGLVKVNGALWSARSCDNSIIQKGRDVKILGIEGVKLIVENKTEESE